MHWMDARALRRKDAFRGERPSGNRIQAPWLVCALWTFQT
ncbi:BEN domain-containing protein 3 [Bienertia sinuspersici]